MLYGKAGLLYNKSMKKQTVLTLILIAVLAVTGCQRSLRLRLSDRKVAGIDVTAEMSESEEPTVEPSGEITENETPETPPETETDEPETTASETTLEPETTAPATTKDPETTVPSTTKAPSTTAPVTTPPATTKAPSTTAPTTMAPTTTKTPETTEDTVHTESNVDRIEIRTLPDKTFYDQYAEVISTKGMTLLAAWADGFEKVITGGWTVMNANGVIDPRTESEGEQTIYVYYGGKSASFTITYRLAEDAPLRLSDAFSAGRVFYQGEYLKHLYFCAYVGNQRLEVSQLTFSAERLTQTGTMTVRISYGKHTAERAFTVIPASQFVLAREDLAWLDADILDRNPEDGVFTARWAFEQAWERYPDAKPLGRPLVSDIIPEEEFTFDPPSIEVNAIYVCRITITCRGISATFELH